VLHLVCAVDVSCVLFERNSLLRSCSVENQDHQQDCYFSWIWKMSTIFLLWPSRRNEDFQDLWLINGPMTA